VLTEIDSPIRETRLTIVDELTRLAIGSDLAMAAAARPALEHLTQDDSRSVAAAAAAALERTAIRLEPDRVDFGQVPPDAPRLVADVYVDGPPLAVADATVTVSGPGLRAMLNGRQLRIVWLPRSDWLDGSVTVRGAAGWSDVRVTGQVTAAGLMSRAAVEAQLRTVDGVGGLRVARVTVLPPPPPPPPRRRLGTVVLAAAVTALVLLGGGGVAMALTMRDQSAQAPAVVQLASAAVSSATSSAEPSTASASPVATVSRVPVAARVRSVDKPGVEGTVKVGTEPEGVTVSPDGKTVYVANQGSHVLSIVDAASHKTTSVQLRNTPRFVTTSRDGRLVFASMYETDTSGSGIAVVDAKSRKVVRYVSTGAMPYALSVGPDGRVWVPIHGLARVEVYSAGQQKLDTRIVLPPNPHAVGFSGELMRAFTADHESNEVAVIDMRKGELLDTVPVSKAPHSIAVSPDGKRVLVAGYEANAVNLIDAVTLKRTGPFPVGKQPQSVAFSTDGEHAYVVDEGDNTVSVLDGHSGKVTATIKVGGSPRTVAVSPDGRLAYVSNGADKTISVLRVGE
jgi:YVTN family beta-propeller protein